MLQTQTIVPKVLKNVRITAFIQPKKNYCQNVDNSDKKKITLKTRERPFTPKIYTKTGDKGNSSLFTGERRPKSDEIFEALGTLDELTSNLGLVRAMCKPKYIYYEQLERIQCILQDVGSLVATPNSSAREAHKQRVEFNDRHTIELEEWIDDFTRDLPPLENFILPGGSLISAQIHVSRSICRRAERRVMPLVLKDEVDGEAMKYLNRLSDYLFTVARYAAKMDKVEETIYVRPDPRFKLYKPMSELNDAWKKVKD